MSRYFLSLVIALLGSSLLRAEPAEDSATGLPEKYANDYLVAGGTISPDKKFAVIYPTRDNEEFPAGKNFIVSLQPFAILGELETKSPYFRGESHGGLSAEWSGDSLVALVTLEGKWGPSEIFLLEFKAGKLSRSTELLAKARGLLRPDYRKAKAQPYNDVYEFVFELEDDPGCKLEGTDRVLLNVVGNTDPKGSATGRVWRGRVTATWDIAQAKLTTWKVARDFAGIRK